MGAPAAISVISENSLTYLCSQNTVSLHLRAVGRLIRVHVLRDQQHNCAMV